mmetsp:Transcript_62759/g.168179  ORF Transcript_62759/g.168179 Transcript_62759/m.168179 type:complete len:84 (-) Transcript_62759:418-669(-)
MSILPLKQFHLLPIFSALLRFHLRMVHSFPVPVLNLNCLLRLVQFEAQTQPLSQKSLPLQFQLYLISPVPDQAQSKHTTVRMG